MHGGKKMTYLESIAFKKHLFPLSQEVGGNQIDNSLFEHPFVLSQREAEAASPENFAVCGEEDPGEGLEFLVINTHSTHI